MSALHERFQRRNTADCSCTKETVGIFALCPDTRVDVEPDGKAVTWTCTKCGEVRSRAYAIPDRNKIGSRSSHKAGTEGSFSRFVSWVGYARNVRNIDLDPEELAARQVVSLAGYIQEACSSWWSEGGISIDMETPVPGRVPTEELAHRLIYGGSGPIAGAVADRVRYIMIGEVMRNTPGYRSRCLWFQDLEVPIHGKIVGITRCQTGFRDYEDYDGTGGFAYLGSARHHTLLLVDQLDGGHLSGHIYMVHPEDFTPCK